MRYLAYEEGHQNAAGTSPKRKLIPKSRNEESALVFSSANEL
jgi:hypothetical protein